MRINTPDDEKDDFFEANVPEKKEKEPRRPALSPEDPKYWDQEESQWEHLIPRRNTRFWIWLCAGAVAVALIVALYIRFFGTNVDFATQYGYVDSIERNGKIFKTYEGVLIPYKEVHDTTRIYDRNFLFTAENAELAIRLKELQKRGIPVMVDYKVYNATVPWRGLRRVVVTAVDSVDPSKILPPEFAPYRRGMAREPIHGTGEEDKQH